ncbi:MAG: methylmalonyl-CoA carboxyltransferase [Clostridiales bacterium]|nr:methylmalonyl-CoA carboxyltransferase [Clostridiales bacterium]
MNGIERLREKRAKIHAGGGEKGIREQHKRGKLTARERLDILFDEGSFVELDTFVKHRSTDFGMDKKEIPGDGVVTGYGRVCGRMVYAYAQDFTAQGGSLGEYHAEKIVKVQDYAMTNGCPIVGLMDSGGARIQEGVNSLNGFAKIFYRNTIASGVIPQISAIMGPCAGGAVYSPAITDFIFMTDKTSNMFITGPNVIKTVTGEEVTTEALGGATVHNEKSGVAHFISKDDRSCIEDIKRLLSFLPSNNLEKPPIFPCTDDINKAVPELNAVVPENPNKAYDMYRVIMGIADNGEIMDVQPLYALNIITCFIRVGGKTVGVIASQPKFLAGCLDVNASDKAARFIRRCDAFNIPMLTLVDVPGFLPGTGQEYDGIIRHGAKMLYAYSEATVPKISIVTRKAYGGAYIAMCSKGLGADLAYAWPTAEIAVMGAEGAANIIFKKEIEASANPQEALQARINEYEDKFSGPYKAAEMGYIDDVIEPQESRIRVVNALDILSGKRQSLPPKKHGNIPL